MGEIMTIKFFGNILTLRFEKTNVGVDHIIISKLIERKNDSKNLTRYLDEVIRSLVLILPKISEYVNNFKEKKLLEKYKTIWSKIEELKKDELNTLRAFYNRYIKTQIRTYDDKVYTMV